MAKETIENKIQKIFDKADELRVLLKLPEEDTKAEVCRYNSFWQVSVRPSLMTFGDCIHLIERGYHGNNLDTILDEALDGAINELELYKQGKTRGI